MTFKQAVVARLASDPDIARDTGGSIRFSRRLTNITAISLQVVADPRPQTFKGFDLRQTTVQVDFWSDDETMAEQLRDRGIAALIPAAEVEGVKFQRAMIAGSRSGGEIEQSGQPQRHRGELFRESVDIIFTHNAN